MSDKPAAAAGARNIISRSLYRRGWTDADLSQATGIPRSRLNQIKNRRTMPTVGEALTIARALRKTIDELFPVEP